MARLSMNMGYWLRLLASHFDSFCPFVISSLDFPSIPVESFKEMSRQTPPVGRDVKSTLRRIIHLCCRVHPCLAEQIVTSSCGPNRKY